MRADIVTARAAVAHAAWHGRTDVDRGATSAPPPGSRCRTAVAATRSTPRAWTRTCSTRLLGDDEPEPEPPTRGRRRTRRPAQAGRRDPAPEPDRRRR